MRRQHPAAERAYVQPAVQKNHGDRGGRVRDAGRTGVGSLVTLYKQYVVRFGLGYSEQVRDDVQVAGYTEPVRMRYAQPAGPVGY